MANLEDTPDERTPLLNKDVENQIEEVVETEGKTWGRRRRRRGCGQVFVEMHQTGKVEKVQDCFWILYGGVCWSGFYWCQCYPEDCGSWLGFLAFDVAEGYCSNCSDGHGLCKKVCNICS